MKYSGDLKAKVAVEAIKGQRTIQEIGSHYGIHPHQVTQWKKHLVESAAELFAHGKANSSLESDEQLRAELYQQIGKLQVDLDWIKQQSGLSR